MVFLLDTNLVSDSRLPAKCPPKLEIWLKDQPFTELRLSSVSVMEIGRGEEKLRETARQWKAGDPERARRRAIADSIQAWRTGLLATFDVVPFDADAALVAGPWLRTYDRISTEDVMIGAIARDRGWTVATRNNKDFKALGVPYHRP